jgi:hypothetical protein
MKNYKDEGPTPSYIPRIPIKTEMAKSQENYIIVV